MSAQRIGPLLLDNLHQELSARDIAILHQVAELRVMSARQIEAVHFSPAQHASQVTATRTGRRVLERLSARRLLVRLERRVGGVQAGSASYLYMLSPLGQRVLAEAGPRRKLREPGVLFVEHTLAIGQLVVELTLAGRQDRLELLSVETEPSCWRVFATVGGRQVLRPDLFVSLAAGDYEHRWFVEVDRGRESLPVLVRKCRTYDAYYRSGSEQARHGVAPRTCWVVPDEQRVDRLEQVIGNTRDLTTRLFTVTVPGQAVAVLSGEVS